MNETVIQYDKDKHYDLFLNFRDKVEAEGSVALDRKKVDPLDFDGAIFFHLIDNSVAAIAAIERSMKYTGETNVARLCRFYILKRYRLNNSGFKLLPYLVEWGISQNFDLLYWTHDKSNRALNALYQHKRIRSTQEKHYYTSDVFLNFKLCENMTFITGSRSMEQYVYAFKLNDTFKWNPKGFMKII